MIHVDGVVQEVAMQVIRRLLHTDTKEVVVPPRDTARKWLESDILAEICHASAPRVIIPQIPQRIDSGGLDTRVQKPELGTLPPVHAPRFNHTGSVGCVAG